MININEHMKLLAAIDIFDGISPDDLSSLINCAQGTIQNYQKNQSVIIAGDEVKFIGIVLSGEGLILKEKPNGDRTVISSLEAGDYFAETICFSQTSISPVSVIASSPLKVLKLNFDRVISTCTNSCGFHSRLISNLLRITAHKNLLLQQHLDVLSQRSIEAKILAFLEHYRSSGSKYITIPFSREEMADYLCVDRTALSHQLSRMKKEGTLDYYKNQFRLL